MLAPLAPASGFGRAPILLLRGNSDPPDYPLGRAPGLLSSGENFFLADPWVPSLVTLSIHAAPSSPGRPEIIATAMRFPGSAPGEIPLRTR